MNVLVIQFRLFSYLAALVLPALKGQMSVVDSPQLNWRRVGGGCLHNVKFRTFIRDKYNFTFDHLIILVPFVCFSFVLTFSHRKIRLRL